MLSDDDVSRDFGGKFNFLVFVDFGGLFFSREILLRLFNGLILADICTRPGHFFLSR